jgi:hypothetical protein
MTSKLFDPYLSFAADVLDDIERLRIAQANRLQILTRTEVDADGEVRGFGLDESHPDVARLAGMVEALKDIESDAVKALQRSLRNHPLHGWVSTTKGIGEKQGARLLAAIGGDPYWNSREDRPRTVSALWAYCGLHVLEKPVDPTGDQPSFDTQIADVTGDQSSTDNNHTTSVPGGRSTFDTRGPSVPGGQDRSDTQLISTTSGQVDADTRSAGAVGGDVHSSTDTLRTVVGVAPRRTRGQRANWSTIAKTRCHLVAESCIKQLKAPCHAATFEGRWIAVHYTECLCSPFRLTYDKRRTHTSVTHPEWTDGHRHNDALRVTSKDILRMLWREGRHIYVGSREGSPKTDQPSAAPLASTQTNFAEGTNTDQSSAVPVSTAQVLSAEGPFTTTDQPSAMSASLTQTAVAEDDPPPVKVKRTRKAAKATGA